MFSKEGNSQLGFHFAHGVLGWSKRSGLRLLAEPKHRHDARRGLRPAPGRPAEAPSNPPPLPPATTEVVGKPEPVPKPDAPVVKDAPNAPVKPPPAPTREPAPESAASAGHAPAHARGRASPAALGPAPEKASQAEKDYGKFRNTARAKSREASSYPARNGPARDQAQAGTGGGRCAVQAQSGEREASRPSAERGRPEHGHAGLAQESKYLDELQGRGLRAQLTGKNTPVIDAAIVGTPEVHSVKSIVPSEGSDVAVVWRRMVRPRPGGPS